MTWLDIDYIELIVLETYLMFDFKTNTDGNVKT